MYHGKSLIKILGKFNLKNKLKFPQCSKTGTEYRDREQPGETQRSQAIKSLKIARKYIRDFFEIF